MEELYKKLENIHTYHQWAHIYQELDPYIECNFHELLEYCISNSIWNLSEYIWTKKYNCDSSIDVIDSLFNHEPPYHFFFKMIQKYFVCLSTTEQKCVLEKYSASFLLSDIQTLDYILQMCEPDIIKINLFDVNDTCVFRVLSKYTRYTFNDVRYHPNDAIVFEFLKMNYQENDTETNMQRLEDCNIKLPEKSEFIKMLIAHDIKYFIDNIYIFYENTEVFTYIIEKMASEVSLKHTLKSLFYDTCELKLHACSKIIYENCKRRFFIFDYKRNDTTALDLILKGFIDEDNQEYDIFDNYIDEKKIYNVTETNTLNFIFHPKCQLYITDTCLYFLKNYHVPLNFFLSDYFYPNPRIANELFKQYPECLFHEKFSDFLQNKKFKAPFGMLIPEHKKNIVCRFFYISDEIYDSIYITYEKYYTIILKYNL